MFGIDDALIAGGAAILGNVAGASMTNDANAATARKSIKFQREMAQKAHQYEVQDLLAAGLNPILSAGGKGASASGGAGFSAPDLSTLGTSAISALTAKASLANIEAQTRKTNAEATLTEKSVPLAEMQNDLLEFGKKLFDRFVSPALETNSSGFKGLETLTNSMSNSARSLDRRLFPPLTPAEEKARRKKWADDERKQKLRNRKMQDLDLGPSP